MAEGGLRTQSNTDELEETEKSQIIKDGKDITDLIVGSHRAYDIFSSFYDEWSTCRLQSISLLDEIRKAIIGNSEKTAKIRDFIAGFQRASNLVELNPNPVLSLGAKIVVAISGLIANLFGPSYSTEDVEKKKFEIQQSFQKDIDTSSLVYIYGVQCSSQFEETCQAINDFHRRIQHEKYVTSMTDRHVLEFLEDISEYNPSNISVFYKRLQFGFEKLIANSDNSNESKAFTRVLEDVPEAIRVINLLAWRFDSDGFDSSILQNQWEKFFEIFNTENASVKTFLDQIEGCLFFLGKERTIFERSVSLLIKK